MANKKNENSQIGQRQNRKTVAQIFSEEWERNVKTTMLADLDQHRENELHLTDENEERDPRNRVNRGTENRQNGQNHNNNGGCQANQPLLNVATSLGAIWQAAIESGAFDDDEAERVKGLHDLGGARIYDKKNITVSRQQKARDLTMRILKQSAINQATQTVAQSNAPKNNKCKAQSNDAENENAGKSNAGQKGAPSVVSSDIFVKSKNSKQGSTSMTRPPPLQPPLPVRMQDFLTIESSTAPDKIIYKNKIRFLTNEIHPAMPALLYLSEDEGGKVMFTVMVWGRKYCHWPISQWKDHMAGESNYLRSVFGEPDGTIHIYDLVFDTTAQMVEFRNTAQELKDCQSNAVASTMPSAGKTVQPTVADSSGTKTVVATRARKKASISSSSSTGVDAGMLATNGVQPAYNAMKHDLLLEGFEPPICQDDDLINLDSPRDLLTRPNSPELPSWKFLCPNAVNSCAGSSESEELFLDSPANKSGSGASVLPYEQAVREFKQTCRSLLSVFLANNISGETMKEIGQTAEGIQLGVTKFIIENARSGGASKEALEKVKELIKVVVADAQFVKTRYVYSIEQLLSMREGTIAPATPLPEFSRRRRETTPRQVTLEPQLTRATADVQWLLGQDKHAAKETTASGGKSFDDSSKTICPRGDKGLQASRWATGNEVIYNNAFTGPLYSNKVRNNMAQELAQLDPETNVHNFAGMQHILDCYFPMTAINTYSSVPAWAPAQYAPPFESPHWRSDSNMRDMTIIQNRFSQFTIRSPPPETAGQHSSGGMIPSIIITDEAGSGFISTPSSLSATSHAFCRSLHPYAQISRAVQVFAPDSMVSTSRIPSTSTLAPNPVLNDLSSATSATSPIVIGDSKQRSASAWIITKGSQLQAPVHVPVKQAPVQQGLTQAAPIQSIFAQPGPIQEIPVPVSAQSVPAQQVGTPAQSTEAVSQLNVISQQAPVQHVVASQTLVLQVAAQKPPVLQDQPAWTNQTPPADPPVRGLAASRHAPCSDSGSSFT